MRFGALSVRFKVGPIAVLVSRAPIQDILSATSLDAVVSSDDTELSMSGGVSQAIARLAGPEMIEEARANAPYRVGDVVVSQAGDLPARYLFHAVTLDRLNAITPSERTVRQLSRQVFVRCETLQIRNVVIPALGTGAAGVSPELAARLLLGCLRSHALNRTVLELVVLTLPSRDAFETFLYETSNIREASLDAITDAGDLLRDTIAGDTTEPLESTRETLSEAESDRLRSTLELAKRPVISQRYVLLEEIGRGGMGIVYLAWDLILRRTVAVKSLGAAIETSRRATDLLRQEAAIGMDLSHHGIVRFYHFEPESDPFGPYIVMEYISWQSGEKWLADSGVAGLPIAPVLSVGRRLCDALSYAHQQTVLHGDIKPSNIFVDPAGERAKLADFGLSRALSPSSGLALQLSPSGTPGYMAPEQSERAGKVGPHTDIYQLGATLWDLLMGEPPPVRRNLSNLIEDPLGRALDALNLALASDPRDRPKDAAEFGDLLSAASPG